jgi:hypothetical protein
MRVVALRNFLAFAATLECGTALALLIDPAIVVRLLLGAGDFSGATLLGRFFGIALLALGMACWPNRPRADSSPSAFWAMFIYNVLMGLYLACLGIFSHLWGLLLWPGVALHLVLALSLVWTWRDEKRTKAPQK